jgi:bifunctional UDP-N-acetylglucosamine pyrophosphorylase/glucosamine-1-phosphate N-acetyltransferase
LKSAKKKSQASTPKLGLAAVEDFMQDKLRKAALDAGVTMIAPETVFLQADTKFGKDVTIEPYVVFGPGVSVGDKAVIHSFSHLVGAQSRRRRIDRSLCAASSGNENWQGRARWKFRRGQGSHDGRRRQANHLAYIGDGRVVRAPISAPARSSVTMTARPSTAPMSAKATFIGSNSALVAP